MNQESQFLIESSTLELDGYLHLPGAVSRPVLDAALFAINSDLIESGLLPDHKSTYEDASYCPRLRRAPEIMDLLYKSAAWPCLELLLGAGQVEDPAEGAQIALRFPEREAPAIFKGPHIDGFHVRGNDLAPDAMNSFTVLVAVFLNDLTEENRGNFTLWPGTHYLNAEQYRRHGVEGFPLGESQVGAATPMQLLANAGDVALIHYLVGHQPIVNASPNIRYAAFFRISCVGLDSHRAESVINPWLDWPGL